MERSRHGVVYGRQIDVVLVVAASAIVIVMVVPVTAESDDDVVAVSAVVLVGRRRIVVDVVFAGRGGGIVAVSLLQRKPQRFFGRHRGPPARLFRIVVERPAGTRRPCSPRQGGRTRQVRVIFGALQPVRVGGRRFLLQVERPHAAAAAAAALLKQVRRNAAPAGRLGVEEPEQRLLGLAYVPGPAAVPAAGRRVLVPFAVRRGHAVQVVERLVGGHHGVCRRHQRFDRRRTSVQPGHGPDARLDHGAALGGPHRRGPVVVHHLFALVLLDGRHAVLGTLAPDHHRRVGAPLEHHAAAAGSVRRACSARRRRRPALDQLRHLVLQVRHPVRQSHVFRLIRVLGPVRFLSPRPASVQLPPERRQLHLVAGRRPVVHDHHAHGRRRHLQQPVQVVVVLHRQHHLTVHFQ